jgi:DNA-binding transcriptional LysR family regulator
MSEMTDLNALRVFSAVAARRSFVGAAAALGIPKATVSRKVQALEARLGLRLLHRTTRRVSLTEAGAAFLERCEAVEEAVAEAEAVVAELGGAPRGTLRVSAPFTLTQGFIAPYLPEFLARHPGLSVRLTLKNDVEDLAGRGVDVAISPWPPGDVRLVARRLGALAQGLYAAPGYLARRGHPRRPAELAGHPALAYTGGGEPGRSFLLASRGRTVEVPCAAVLACNDFTPLRAAAVAGAGVMLAAHDRVAEDVAAGRLARVLPAWDGPPIEIRAIYASRAGLAPKVKAFVEFMAEVAARLERPRRPRPARSG